MRQVALSVIATKDGQANISHALGHGASGLRRRRHLLHHAEAETLDLFQKQLERYFVRHQCSVVNLRQLRGDALSVPSERSTGSTSGSARSPAGNCAG